MNNTENMKSMLMANSVRHALDELTVDTLDDFLGNDGVKNVNANYAGAVAIAMTMLKDGMARNGLYYLQPCPELAAFAEYPDADHRLSAFHCGVDFVRNLPAELPLDCFLPDFEAEKYDYAGPLGISIIYPDEDRQMHINIVSLYAGIPYDRLFNLGIDVNSVVEEDSEPIACANEADIESVPSWTGAFAAGVLASMDHVTKKGWHRG